jgi:predicted TIM-barrel fold metal-dependent hydrolase
MPTAYPPSLTLRRRRKTTRPKPLTTSVRLPDNGSMQDDQRPHLVRKDDFDAIRDLYLPIPTQIVATDEFLPIAQTAPQKRVEAELLKIADGACRKLGISRRKFLSSSAGMAAAFLAMNAAWGCRAFDVDPAEVYELGAGAEKWPKNEFIFDIHTHHVATGRQIETPPLLRYRDFGAMMGNSELQGKTHVWDDLYLANYVKEMFFDSDTTMAVITGLPSKIESQNVLPPAEMIESRAGINGLARSQRVLAHGLFAPDLGVANLEDMHHQAEKLKVDAWKGYPGQPLADGSKGWFMDDEKLAYPAYEYSRRMKIRNICVHKGLPLPGWDLERSGVRDIPKAAADFPDLNFLIYHAAFKGIREAMEAVANGFDKRPDIPWISELCEIRKKTPSMTNVYMDIGTTFAMVAVANPQLAAYILGIMIEAFGDDHVLWGTDSIWWGSPQWQIEAFRRLQMPAEFQEKFGFAPLTAEVKAKIFGLNSARVYGIDVDQRLRALPGDAVTKLKAAYQQSGGVRSNTQYGWVVG